jgi:hypothetical protein
MSDETFDWIAFFQRRRLISQQQEEIELLRDQVWLMQLPPEQRQEAMAEREEARRQQAEANRASAGRDLRFIASAVVVIAVVIGIAAALNNPPPAQTQVAQAQDAPAHAASLPVPPIPPAGARPRAVQCSQLKHQLARALNPARAAAYLS